MVWHLSLHYRIHIDIKEFIESHKQIHYIDIHIEIKTNTSLSKNEPPNWLHTGAFPLNHR